MRPEYLEPAPDVDQSEPADSFRVINLPALVRMKLTSLDKDRTHLRDLLEIWLIDQSWCSRLPKELADRLQLLINHPDGSSFSGIAVIIRSAYLSRQVHYAYQSADSRRKS